MAFGVVLVYRIACSTTNGMYGSMGHHYHSWRIASVLIRRDVVQVLLMVVINIGYRGITPWIGGDMLPLSETRQDGVLLMDYRVGEDNRMS